MGGRSTPPRLKHVPLETFDKPAKTKRKNRNDGCFERLPYASLIATVLCVVGVILFCVMMKLGLGALFEQFQRVFHANKWNWLDKVQIFFVIVAVVMCIFTLFFAVAGFFATGGTRESMFRDSKSRSGGRCTCVLIILLCFVLLGFWIVALGLTSALIVGYHIADSLCATLHDYSEIECLDFSVFRPLVESYTSATLNICGGDVQQFCALSKTAYSWFWVGWAGAVLALYGLVQFIAAHAANYSHIGNSWKYVELHECLSENVPPPLPLSKMPPPPPFYNNNGIARSRERFDKFADINRSQRRPTRGSLDDRERYTAHTSSTQMAVQQSDTLSQYNYKGRSKHY